MKKIIVIVVVLLFAENTFSQIMASSYQAANHVQNFITGGMTVRYEIGENNSYSGGSTLTDLMGTANATAYNTPSYVSIGTRYLNLSSSSSNYILTGNIGSTNNQSVFMWIYPTGDGVILSELGQASINTSYHDSNIEMVSGTLKFSIWNTPTITSSVATALNKWHYIGLTYDGTTLIAYVNGVQAGSINSARTPPTNLYYGIGALSGTNMGNGGYGNFRFSAFHYYKRALSSNEVKLNYEAKKAKFVDPVIFSQTFTSGVAPGSTIETAFNTFRATLTGSYTTFKIYSNLDTTGITVTDATLVPQIADALRTATIGSWTIGSNTWKVDLNCGTPSIGGASVIFTNSVNGCSCGTGTIYTIRPHINNYNWGGIGGECSQPTQTLTLVFY
jgi:hypothetical protein